MTRLLDTVPMPARIAQLPRNHAGYPVPWFAATMPDGTRDFRVVAPGRVRDAVRFRLCWVCGETVSAYKAFVIGPMCAVNRTTAEPPCHRDCAVYSAQVCPFLTVPAMRRRDTTLPEDSTQPAGIYLDRNPGVALVWTTKKYQLFADGTGGVLFRIGDPVNVAWYAHGRLATAAEARAALESGLPILRDMCDGPGDHAELDRFTDRTMPLLPPTAGTAA